MCRGGCHFHFLLAQHVLRRQLRFTNQPCMFSEVTKTCVPLGCRVCFDGFKLKKKKGPTLWESWGEESLPNWPYQNGCIPAPPPTQPNPGLLGLGLCQAVEPCCLKTLKMCGNTYLPRKSQTGEVYTFPQTLLFNLLR